MGDSQLESAKRHFDLSFAMLDQVIAISPDELWEAKRGGIVYWQQLFHTLTGIYYWMRPSGDRFEEPFAGRGLYPELEQDPESHLSRAELLEFLENVKTVVRRFFDQNDDAWLYEKSAVNPKIKNIDIIYMQIRHIQYHVGHCEAILRENNYDTAEWLDWYGG
jgi:uncharacterized damage-inducible protein DinB